MKSNEVIFGWIVNADGDVANDKVTVSGIKNGKYKLRIYHTWRGMFLEEREVAVTDGSVSLGPPYMRIRGSQANYIGQDMAFILEYVPEPVVVPTKQKGRGK